FGFDRPGWLERRIAVGDARGGPTGAALREGVVVGELPIHQRRYVEVALIGKVEGELQTGDNVALGGAEIAVLRVGIQANLERDVMQRALSEGLGVEDLVPAEGRAEKAIDFCRAGTARGR